MKSWTSDAVAYGIYLSNKQSRKKKDNERYQEDIRRSIRRKKIANERYQENIRCSFQQPESAEFFGFLLRYGSLTRDQMAALSNQTPSRDTSRKSLEELQECGYLETCDTRNRVYRLSDKAFWDPETDRPNPSDVDAEELMAAITGVKENDARRGKGCRRRKTTAGKMVGINHNKSKKRRIESNDRMSSRTRLQRSTVSTLAVFQNEDLMGEVAEYLDAKTLLFTMVAISKTVRPRISHEHAMRCAMATKRGRKRMQHLMSLIRKDCIYTPSPMRILKLATGRRCEKCNRTQTNNLNALGLFLCTSCISTMVTEAKSHGEQAHMPLFRAAIDEDRCAKLVRTDKKTVQYFMYAENTPFHDRANEKVGPLMSLGNLTSAANLETPPSPEILIEILESVSADDPYRSKIPLILEACETLHPMGQKYNHLGIVDHSGPFRGVFRSMWQVLVQWENGERTWQPLTQFAMDDFESCASYARDHDLIDTKGWKRFRR
jgi:hypothetical protein